MRTVAITMGLLTAAALAYEFSWVTLAVGVGLTILMPLGLGAYGKKLAAEMDADKRAALESIAHMKNLERQLADLKRSNPWTKSCNSNPPTGGSG